MNKNVPYKRTDRMSDLLRKIVSEAFVSKVHHFGTEGVTVTEVQVTPDFKQAKVYYRLLDPSKRLETRKALEKIKPLVQKEIAKGLQTRNTPVIRFEYDESIDYGNHIESLLSSVRNPKSEEE